MPRFGWPYLSKPARGATIDRTSPLAQGLVAALPMSDGAGGCYDAASGAYWTPGAGSAAPTWSASPYGLATSFASASSQSLTGPSLQATAGLSGAAWTAAWSARAASSFSFGLIFTTSGSDVLYMRPSAGLIACYPGPATWSYPGASQQQWHHYAIRVASTSAEFFIDGASQGIQSISAAWSWATAAAIGFASSRSAFNGSIGYWHAWDSLLDSGLIAALAANPWQIIAPGPLRSWVFFQGSGAPSFMPWIFGDQIGANGIG
jgi:hypothetical protein